MKKITVIFFILLLTPLLPAFAQYRCCLNGSRDFCGNSANYTTSDCGNACVRPNQCTPAGGTTSPGQPVTLENPLGNNVTPEMIIGRVINAILGVVGSLALLMFVYGGLVWMTAAGAADKTQKGKDIIMWATIGLVVIFTSYALVNFVLQSVIGGSAVQ